MDRFTLMRLLGEWPARCASRCHTLELFDCGSYLREKVEYETEPGEWVRAYLCLPKLRGPQTAAIFCHHQHDWNFALGKSEVVGLSGDPDQAYAAELTERGYITFSPDALGFEERNWTDGDFATCYYELATRLIAARTLLAKVLHDVMVGIDFLVSREEVDPARIGFLGHSYGGRMALWAPAIDRRIAASVSNCGCVSYRDSLDRNAGIQMEFCVPGILEEGDIEDVVGLVAPTPLLLSVGETDIWSRGAQQLFDRVKDRFPEDHLQLRIWPGGHSFTALMRAECYAFLDRHLLRR